MRKILILLLFLSSFLTNLSSQKYFSKEVWPMDFINGRGPLILHKDTIIICGFGTDSFSYRKYNICLAKFNIKGEFIERSIDLDGDYFSYYLNNAYLLGDKIVTAYSSWERDGYNGGYLVVVDIKSGKFEKKIKITAPQDEERIGNIVGLEQTDAANYIVISSIDEKGLNKIDTEICLVNIETSRVKKFELGTKNKSDIPFGHKWNGKYLLIGSSIEEKDFSILNPYEKINVNSIIYEADTSGAWKEVYRSDDYRGYIYSIFMTEDSSYICSSIKINYYNIPDSDKYIWHNYFIVFKLNKYFVLMWEKRWGVNHDYNWIAQTSKIIRSNENDGYILIGYCPNYEWTKDGTDYTYIPKEVRDSMNKAGNPPMEIGLLQKINEQGDSVWLRTFSLIKDTSAYWVDHVIHDIVPAPDGGYIMSGDIAYPPITESDTSNNYPAWLLKVDQYGCLVPGCQNGDTVNVTEEPLQNELLVYPNPSSDILYIYDDQGGQSKYTITDLKGNIIRKWSGNLKDHTYIVHLHDFSLGIYIVSRIDDRDRVRSVKFVKG